MRSILKVLFLLLTIIIYPSLLFADNSDKSPRGETRIMYGSSFGECGGYCQQELVLTPEKALLKQSSYEPERFPARFSEKVLSAQEWTEVLALIDPKTLLQLQDVYDCPDCHDQGAEWVEIILSDFHKRIFFSYGDNILGISELLNKLRTITTELSPVKK